jgi:hypothetical protein
MPIGVERQSSKGQPAAHGLVHGQVIPKDDCLGRWNTEMLLARRFELRIAPRIELVELPAHPLVFELPDIFLRNARSFRCAIPGWQPPVQAERSMPWPPLQK